MYNREVELTGTNRPRACHTNPQQNPQRHPRNKLASTSNTKTHTHTIHTDTRAKRNVQTEYNSTTSLALPCDHPRRARHQSYGGHSERETPGPIPNPEVKPFSADGTATERLWESRTPPNIFSVRCGTTTSGSAPDAFHDVLCAGGRNGRQGTTDARTALYRT